MDTQQIKETIQSIPIPMCVLDEKGDVIAASPGIAKVFLYDGVAGSNIFALTGIKYEDILGRYEKGGSLSFSSNERSFHIEVGALQTDPLYLTLSFSDCTELEDLQVRYNNQQMHTIIVDVDNFYELTNLTGDSGRQELISKIDKTVRGWAAQMKASVTKYVSERYMLYAEKKYVAQQERSQFNVLSEIREIPTAADFPVTLSIGIGSDGESPAENERFAKQALDMAKGRGGDQVVIKRRDSLTYYGGVSRTVEKRNKGKSRVIGYALQSLMDSASNVLIMGHTNPDMDAFGAALGIYCLARHQGKRAYIVVDHTTEALSALYEEVKSLDEHEIIGSQRALQVLDEKSVVIMVDTHRPGISECPELFEKAVRTVVIDHHRKSEEFSKTPTLVYTENYASSASELVAEILQYTVEREDILKVEANALLAGIELDTNSFAVKSGVRTFEACAWLKRMGADSEEVKRYFQISDEMFQLKARCYQSAYVDEGGMAYAVYNGRTENAQIVNAQVADALLTVRGVKASFVASRNMNGRTYISARSLGEVNVQLIMEEFGGGGHLNTAGAQMEITPEEAIGKIQDYLKESAHRKEAEQQLADRHTLTGLEKKQIQERLGGSEKK